METLGPVKDVILQGVAIVALEAWRLMATVWTFLFSDAGQKLIQNMIAVTALIFAIRGVRNWSQERRDLRRAELAEKALATTYRAKDAISFVRSPFGFGGEGQTRKRGENESPEQSAALDSAFSPIERLNKMGEVFEEIQSLRYSISAAFNPAASEPLSVFLRIRAEIITASHSKMREATYNRPMNEAAIARAERNDAVIWEGYGEAELIVPRIDAAIAALEATFRPYVEATFQSFDWWPKWFRKK